MNDELSDGKTIVKIIYLVVFKNVQISLLQQIPTRNPGVIHPSIQCSFFRRVKVSGICLFRKRVLEKDSRESYWWRCCDLSILQ